MSLAGPLPDDGPRRSTFNRTDLLVLPSRGETFGMVVTEALARGIPVLTTDVDALPDTLGQAPDGACPVCSSRPTTCAALTEALRR